MDGRYALRGGNLILKNKASPTVTFILKRHSETQEVIRNRFSLFDIGNIFFYLQ